jgi:guanylate kinase
MKKNLVIVISGPSGSGKTTICERLAGEIENLEISVSTTTRKPRPNEINGKHYFFISEQQFKKYIEEGKFLEWTKRYGNYYGTMKESIERLLDKNVDILLALDINGGIHFKKNYKDSILIFLIPPSLDVLKRRLEDRDTDSKESIEGRFKQTKSELKNIFFYDYFVINDKLEDTIWTIKSIILAEKSRTLRLPEVLLERFGIDDSSINIRS